MPDCNGGAQEPSGTRIACFTPEKISYFLKELPLDYPFPVCSPVIEKHQALVVEEIFMRKRNSS